MRPIDVREVLPLARYERERETIRRRIIDLKKRRRVGVGPAVSLVFENRDTVLYQIQEMVRAERITESEKLAEEVATYNEILPRAGELAATLFIELTDPVTLQRDLDRFLGIDRGAVFLEAGDGGRVPAVFEEGHSDESQVSAVHYLRFPLTREAARAIRDGATPLALVIDHPSYQARAALPDAVRESLREDLDTT